MDTRIGFMGLGIMGRAMAENILKNGHPLTVYNRTREKASLLADLGATVAATPRELAEASDIVIVMLTGPGAFADVLRGEDGCAAALRPGQVVVNMSTVSPADTREFSSLLAPSGARYVDAPVVGSKKPAEQGQLVILAGGDEAVVKGLEPVLLAMGKRVVHCGPVGSGSMLKMAVNLLLGVMLEGLCESVNFARKGGLDPAMVLDVLGAGPLGCGLFALKGPMLASGVYQAQFPLKHMAKDLKCVLDTAYDTGAPVPAASTALGLYQAARDMGLEDMDAAVVMKALETLTGH